MTVSIIDKLKIVFYRLSTPGIKLLWRKHPQKPVTIDNTLIELQDRSIPIRTYTPIGNGPFPVIVFFHGGGFVICNLESHDDLCRDLCGETDCIVISVDYRLAPEHRFPAAPDDCLAAVEWAYTHAHEFNGIASHMLVAGDSAGGNLAAVTALQLQAHPQIRLAGQILVYPVADYHTPPTASYMEYDTFNGLNGRMMCWFWKLYLNDASEADNPLACPNKASIEGFLPPALVILAGQDPLRDEGKAYADKLAAAGIAVEQHLFPDEQHGFWGTFGPNTAHSQAMAMIRTWIKNSGKINQVP